MCLLLAVCVSEMFNHFSQFSSVHGDTVAHLSSRDLDNEVQSHTDTKFVRYESELVSKRWV